MLAGEQRQRGTGSFAGSLLPAGNFGLRTSDFGLLSGFGFRISDFLALLALLALLCLFSPPARAQVAISEFMAGNTRTLADDFGLYEDWIEIQNYSATNVNLLDWGLTDASGSPFKWRFPSTNLPPGGYLVVFASNRDRRTPGAALHTNFKLDAGGEYLALVRPDGVVATQFAPKFPAQANDVSYGFGTATTSVGLLSTGSLGRVRVPLDASLGTNWLARTFDDSAWTAATNGIGYETGQNEFGTSYDADVLADAPVGYWRLNETSTNATAATNIGTAGTSLNGAFISGVTVSQAGPRPATYNGFTTTNRAVRFNGTSGRVDVPFDARLNPAGSFTVEFWAMPAAAPAAGSFFCPLSSIRWNSARRNGYLFFQNPAGQWEFRMGNNTSFIATAIGGAVTLNGWQHVAGVYNGTNVLLYVNGALAATAAPSGTYSPNNTNVFRLGATGNGNGTYFFNGYLDEPSFINRALSAAELATHYQLALTGVGTATNFAGLIRTDLRPAMFGTNTSAYFRLPFVLPNLDGISGLKLRMKCDDGFASWVNGVAAATVNAPVELEWNAAATNRQAIADAVQFKSFDLSAWIPSLVAGANVLALQGLNLAATNTDFLLLPELELQRSGQYLVEARYFLEPSPGAINGTGTRDLGPILGAVTHFPNVPTTNDSLTVTCRVTQALSAVATVKLNWQVMFNTLQQTTMLDDGQHGDGAAGDGVFGAVITNVVSGVRTYTAGQMVRWFVSAADSQSRTSRWPLFTSPTDSAEFLGTVVADPALTSRIPIFHLFVASGQLGGMDTETGGRVSLFYDGEFYDNVYMELRGNSTAWYPKKSHRLEMNREHKLRHPGPGGRVRKTSFTADYPDPAYMRQRLSFWFCNQIGAPAPYYYPVRIQRNGEFYQLANHNNVLGDELMDYLGYDPEGALYKAAGTVVPSRQSTGGWVKLYPNNVDYSDYMVLANGIAETVTLAQRRINLFDLLDLPEVISYLVAARFVHENDDVWANMSLYRDTYGSREWRIIPFDMNLSWGAAYMDDAAFSGIQVTNDTLKSFPLYGSSYALVNGGGNWNRMYDAIFSVPQTRAMFQRRMRTVLDTWIQPPNTPATNRLLEPMLLGWRDELAAEAEVDRDFWGWPGKGGQCNFDPGIDLTNGVNQLLTLFLEKRRQHFYGKHSVTNTAMAVGVASSKNAGIPLAQPANAVIAIASMEVNPASGNQDQEWVCLTNANGFAVDISGWKLDGGVRHTFRPGTVIPALSAIYASPDVVAFRARTTVPRGGMGLFVQGNYDGHLSARGETLTLADQQGRMVSTNTAPGNPSLAQQFLRITEVMYNPAPTPGSAADPQLCEYLELKNISPDTALDLTGVRLTNGVVFFFTGSAVTSLDPGASVLVVRDSAAFTARYGSGLPIAGQFTGALANSGETIRLEDAVGEKIVEFTYNNTWYPITDGFGFSLVIVDELAPWDTWDRKASWRASGALRGSPGVADPAPAATAPIIINEVLAHTDPPLVDSIELFNPTTTNVNIGGWLLTDNFYLPGKYRLPADATVPAGGFLVLDAGQFSAGTNGFAFSEYGEQAYLFAADAGTNLTGYYHGWDFAASPVNVSFGRYVDSQTNAHLVLQRAVTLHATNAYPLIGPVVISEIMYHPPDLAGGFDDDANEFIELCNRTSTNVPLFCTFTNELGYGLAARTNTWRLRNAVDFDFPTNTTLAGGARLLVVGFAPTNTTLATAFRAKWNVPAEVPLFGPWSGKLDNQAETVELKLPEKPDVTPTNVIVPYVQAEEVSYHDTAPWPTDADGVGNSLQRINLGDFADDPINWSAVSVTAGRANAITLPPVVTLTTPTNGASFFRAGGLTLAATASDPDGSVAQVEFFAGETLLSVATSAPYRFDWTNPPYGQFQIRAVATDNLGAIASSSVAAISVVSLPPTLALLSPTNGAWTPAGSAFYLEAVPADADGIIAGVDFYADGILIASVGGAPWTASWSDATPGWHTITTVARDDSGAASPPASAAVFIQAIATNLTVVIASNSTWRYFDLGTDPGGWTTLAYDDSGWSNGVAELGYGDTPDARPEATVIRYGANASSKYPAYYFRKKFVVNSPAEVGSTLLRVMHDDGAIAWLNGVEIDRYGMPAGTVTYTTLSPWTASNADEYTMFPSTFNPSLLLAGTNLLAIEVHQCTAGSSDISFAAELSLGVPVYGPAITSHPEGQSAPSGSTASFAISAVGDAPLTYQWLRNGLPLAGRTSAQLTLTNLQFANAGAYSVRVSNPYGIATSLVATLTVTLGDADGDGLPDAWEMANGTNPNVPDASADPDGDGHSNWQEYLAGTSPTNAASVLRLTAEFTPDGEPLLSFPAASNHAYSLLGAAALGESWQTITNIPAAPTNRQLLITNAPSDTRFFRLLTPPASPLP